MDETIFFMDKLKDRIGSEFEKFPYFVIIREGGSIRLDTLTIKRWIPLRVLQVAPFPWGDPLYIKG